MFSEISQKEKEKYQRVSLIEEFREMEQIVKEQNLQTNIDMRHKVGEGREDESKKGREEHEG